ncbi:MAG TPA: PIN domain-containing protein, partial [Oligoflexia bacterium]|nr:PIN domain-containing protein [Oligoflexia bacterium]
MKRHIFVLDTSAIIALVQDITTIRDSSAPGFACVLGDNDIVIPRVVLDELADLRKGGGEKGHVALEAARQIENYSLSGCLVKGVETEKGGLLRIAPRPSPDKVISWDLRADVADHEILATALDIEAKIKERQSAESFNPGQVVTVEQGLSNGKSNVTLITQDRILRVLARSIYSIAAEELQSVCAPEIEYEQGYHRIELSSEEIDHILASGTYVSKFQPGINEFFHLVDRENPDVHYCYGMSRKLGSYEVTLLDRSKVDYLKVAGEVTGRNVRQKLFLWTLMGCGDADPMSPNGIR